MLTRKNAQLFPLHRLSERRDKNTFMTRNRLVIHEKTKDEIVTVYVTECRIYGWSVKTHLQFEFVCGPKFMSF